MVRYSDNDATTSMVTEVGGVEAALERVAGATGVQWETAATWGRVGVTALEVATAYLAFRYAALDGHPTARAAFETMRTVDEPQRLGLDTAWADALGGPSPEPPLAIKCGWYVYSDLVLRTHAVILTEDDGMVALTGIPITQGERDGWAAEYDKDPANVLAIHRRHADPLLREAIRLTRRSD